MRSSARPHTAPSVAAVVATRSRFDLLCQRALPSILAQTRLPDTIVIVVDQTAEELPDDGLAALADDLKSACPPPLRLTVLRNRRTPRRAAGAWNTAIDHLHRDPRFKHWPERCFVAILDDDDSWEPEHLQRCLDHAIAADLTMVASGLIRHDTADGPGRCQSSRASLDQREQFIRGQHIQGSNLFVRLDLLLLAGLFDEHLPSCTDRDLCIRLASLSSLRFGALDSHTVHHFADARSDRLSTPGSDSKLEGLSRFWHKHAPRFDEEARSNAAERAKALFGWDPPQVTPKSCGVPALEPSARPMAFVVGFVTDAVPLPHVDRLLEDLLELGGRPDINGLVVVIVENGPLPVDGRRPLHALVDRFRARGLAIELAPIETQRTDWESGRLPDTPNPATRRLPIAASRTVLHSYVARAASLRPGFAAWILDDDKRLSVLVDTGAGLVKRRSPDIATLWALRDAGVDVVIGPDTAAAPLPVGTTIRMQLLQVEKFLATVEQAKVGASPAAWGLDPTGAVSELRDAHYDLARQTEHVETPSPISPALLGTSAGETLGNIARQIGRLLAGESVLLPLAQTPDQLSASAAMNSVQRGGSAVFFNHKHLEVFPQTIAQIDGRHVRRSDMLTALLLRQQLGLRIVMHASVGVRHDRSELPATGPCLDVLCDDVLGYALFRSVDDLLRGRPPAHTAGPLLAWSPVELDEADRLMHKYVEERLAAISLARWRILGLVDAILGRAHRLQASGRDWSLPPASTALKGLIDEIRKIEEHFRRPDILNLAEEIERILVPGAARRTFQSMDGFIVQQGMVHHGSAAGLAALADSREAKARSLLARTLGLAGLRLLGTGGEGVVFTDGARVFKVLDIPIRRPGHDASATLQALRTPQFSPRHLYALALVESHEETLVIAYPYEESDPYTGGLGAQLIALLQECRAAGICFRNMHPRNLRVASGTLKLVDYGADIRPFTEDGYRSMAQRAWLTFRWHHRPDLDRLMRRALTNPDIPELDGFDRFWQALLDEAPSATRLVSRITVPIVHCSGARSVLDYGCGKAADSSRQLALLGLRTVGYDPGQGMVDRWASLGPLPSGLLLTSQSEAALASGPYDAVVCSLVLCELGEGDEYEQVLADLSGAVVPGGMVVVTVCHPHSTFGGPTSLHPHRELPADAAYGRSFWYTERGAGGGSRREFHRPLRVLERDLLRHGIEVQQRVASASVDTERFEHTPDFLTLVCRRRPPLCRQPTVSLLVKCCAMEAGTIERQVAHIVGQLEGPRTFAERVLVIDSRSDGFVRPHAEADMAGLVAAASRLQATGFVDRVLLAPEPGPQAGRILRDWFDVECDQTHSAAGAPLAAPLMALEACVGEYVLQVDSDILVHRRCRSDDYLGEMIAALESLPRAVTASLSASGAAPRPTSAAADRTPWRVEARACLLHRQRLLAARPFPNRISGDAPVLSWHRSLDEAAQAGRIESLRGVSTDTWFVHPPNDLKGDPQEWMLMMDLVERQPPPAAQIGVVDLVGGPMRWVPRERDEPFIFVMTGRNVPPGRVGRCLASVAAQRRQDWGAVIVDDASDELHAEAVRLAVEPWRERVTLIQPRSHRGQMANLALAIRHVCTDPTSVVLTLDLDDALLGSRVLDRVHQEYARGADVTVGSMLRTDKHVVYSANLDDPRGSGGGNVWQHLRTFRKHLFDAIPDQDLRVDGRYVDIAVDWSFMLPIVEMAERKSWIPEPLYLYEPSGLGKGEARPAREAQIGAIVAKPRRRPTASRRALRLLHPDELKEEVWRPQGGILFIRHAERPGFAGLSKEQQATVVLTAEGRRSAEALGGRLGAPDRVMSSPVARARETADLVRLASPSPPPEVRVHRSLVEFYTDEAGYRLIKSRLGWREAMQAWLDGSFRSGILLPCHQVALRALRDCHAAPGAPPQRTIAVTHDYVIMALLATLRGVRATDIPFLAGILVDMEEAHEVLQTESR